MHKTNILLILVTCTFCLLTVGEEMINLAIPAPKMKETTETQDTNNDTDAEVNPLEGTKEELVSEPIESQTSKQKQGPKTTKSGGCLRMFSGVLVLYRGWRVYMGYKVAFAGLGLACLYMTVLGFDNITVGMHWLQFLLFEININSIYLV